MHKTRKWESDAEYLKDQDEHNSWGAASPYGVKARGYFVMYGEWLGDRLFHDDRVVDFGGNDGTAAHRFYMDLKIKPTVIDCEANRVEFARERYGLPAIQAFIEDLSEIPDKHFRWGFSSHTLEHLRDTEAGLKEMSRVVSEGCLFIVPLEPKNHAKGNHAHAISTMRVSVWKDLIAANGWKVIKAERKNRFEAAIYAEAV